MFVSCPHSRAFLQDYVQRVSLVAQTSFASYLFGHWSLAEDRRARYLSRNMEAVRSLATMHPVDVLQDISTQMTHQLLLSRVGVRSQVARDILDATLQDTTSPSPRISERVYALGIVQAAMQIESEDTTALVRLSYRCVRATDRRAVSRR